MAVVESLWIIPYSGAEPVSKTEVSLVAGRGIEGDRYFAGIGTYSVLPEKGRQVTLISSDSINKAATEAGVPLTSVGKLRRNVAIGGLDGDALLHAVGQEIQVGSATVFVHRNCVPCMYNEKLNGLDGLMETFWDVAGVSCEVVKSGRIRVGDQVRISVGEKDVARISHDKPPSFFVRPSKRVAEDVKAKYAKLAELRHELEQKDPEGLRRLEGSYSSVGLRFFPWRSPQEGSTETGFQGAGALMPVVIVLGVLLWSRMK